MLYTIAEIALVIGALAVLYGFGRIIRKYIFN